MDVRIFLYLLYGYQVVWLLYITVAPNQPHRQFFLLCQRELDSACVCICVSFLAGIPFGFFIFLCRISFDFVVVIVVIAIIFVGILF